MGKTYKIDGKTYELLPPVLGVMRPVALHVTGMSAAVQEAEDMLQALGDKQAMFVALLVTPQGVHPKDRDLEAMAQDVEWSWPPEKAAQAVRDFFDQDGVREQIMATLDLESLALKMAVSAARKQSTGPLDGKSTPASSTEQSSSSRAETSSSATASSGPSPSKKPLRTSGKGSGK